MDIEKIRREIAALESAYKSMPIVDGQRTVTAESETIREMLRERYAKLPPRPSFLSKTISRRLGPASDFVNIDVPA